MPPSIDISNETELEVGPGREPGVHIWLADIPSGVLAIMPSTPICVLYYTTVFCSSVFDRWVFPVSVVGQGEVRE